MSNKPYRLAQSGSRIDRTKKVHFSFDGKQLSGFAGDTLASAVMANGTKLFGRSFKYHRPRGVVGLGSEEMNALVGVGDGRIRFAGHNVFTSTGEVVVANSELRFRSLAELTDSLVKSGFSIEHVYGDWDRGPITSISRVMVFVARRK